MATTAGESLEKLEDMIIRTAKSGAVHANFAHQNHGMAKRDPVHMLWYRGNEKEPAATTAGSFRTEEDKDVRVRTLSPLPRFDYLALPTLDGPSLTR
jgi:hypothetical protein